MTTSDTREQLRDMIDRLPERELELAKRFLQFLILSEGDPMIMAFENAPEEEEELSEAELRELEEARAEAARGEVYSWEEVKRELHGE